MLRILFVVVGLLTATVAQGQAIPTTIDFTPLPPVVDAPPFVVPSAYAPSCIEPTGEPNLAPPPDAVWFDAARELKPAEPVAPSLPPAPPNYGAEASQSAESLPKFVPRFPHVRNFFSDVWQDYRNYYSRHNFYLFIAAFSGGAILAESDWDQDIRDSYQQNVGYSSAFHNFHIFGEGYRTIPIFVTTMVAGWVLDEYAVPHAIGEWGEQSLRAAAVGALPMFVMQHVTGGSRPHDGTHGSRWHFMADNNGVSGHAFMGAVPFLTAARLTKRPLLKAGFFAGSFLTGWSRFSDDQHYLSQVLLGWAMAGMAVSAVGQTETGQPFRLVPWSSPNGFGLGWEFRH